MNKKKTLIIVIASSLVVIIGIVAVVLALRGKNRNTVVDTTTTVTESADITTDSTSEEYATPPSGDNNEESGEGNTDSSNENSDSKDDAPTDAPTDSNEETEKETEPSDEGEKETEPVVDSPVDGTDAPTEAPETVAPTEPQTEAPTPAPTEPPTEAPKPAPTVPPTQAPKPMTDEEKLKEMGVTYSANSDGGVTITGGNLTGDVVIPATIDGKKVVLGELSFYENSAITSLVINCETIENYAFNDMDSLKSVVIGANVKTLGEAAFANCSNLESVTFLGEQITEFPQGLFAACPKLLSLTIPRSVTKVNASAFPEASCYLELVYGGNIPPLSTIDYSAIVPEFTLYAYNEPDLIYEDFIKYIEYENLEAGLKAVRMYNYKVVYR